MDTSKLLFCGGRRLAAQIAQHCVDNGAQIVGLGLNVPTGDASDGPDAGLRTAAGVGAHATFFGRSFVGALAQRRFAAAQPDLGICCGFATILPPDLLRLPRWGWVNVHRSLLPYNRGLDPLQWALVDRTPAGASLHVMTPRLDDGPIIGQQGVPVGVTDDIGSLRARVDAAAFRLFQEYWPRLRVGDLAATPQEHDLATTHSADDCEHLRRLDLGAVTSVQSVLDVLRAYSDPTLPAYFVDLPSGRRYALQLQITPLDAPEHT